MVNLSLNRKENYASIFEKKKEFTEQNKCTNLSKPSRYLIFIVKEKTLYYMKRFLADYSRYLETLFGLVWPFSEWSIQDHSFSNTETISKIVVVTSSAVSWFGCEYYLFFTFVQRLYVMWSICHISFLINKTGIHP